MGFKLNGLNAPLNGELNGRKGTSTLIEILTVIPIIRIAAGPLLLPVLTKPKEKAKRLTCMNYLRQVNLSLRMYARIPTVASFPKAGYGECRCTNYNNVIRKDKIWAVMKYLAGINCFPTAENCAALAYGKVTFSGVAGGFCDINLNGTFAEGAVKVSGTFEKKTGHDEGTTTSVTVSTDLTGDVAQAQNVNSVSVTQQFTGNVAGQLEKGAGTCMVRGAANNGAYKSTAHAESSIDTCNLTLDYGGSGVCPPELCAQHTH